MAIDKKSLCDAFCGDLEVTDVPAGLAVRTAFYGRDGDAIGFYVTRSQFDRTKWRLEDSGMIVPVLEAAGVDLDRGTRADAFQRLLQEYGAQYDVDSFEIVSPYVAETDLPTEAMRFIALLLRVRDLELLSPEQVENTFRQDAEKAPREAFANTDAKIRFNAAPTMELSEFEADAVIENKKNRAILALFIGTHEGRVNEAVMAWMENRMQNAGVRVALLLEDAKPSYISNKALTRAMNRLDSYIGFRGDETGAMNKVARVAGLEEWH